MLDLKFVLENLDRVRAGVAAKNVRVDLDAIPPLAEKRKAATAEGDKLRAERNALSEEVGKLKKAGKDASAPMARSTALISPIISSPAGPAAKPQSRGWKYRSRLLMSVSLP